VERVFILGGAGGIGSALARLIVARGGRVFLAGRDESKLAALAAELGVDHAAQATVDATDPDSVDACADAAAAALGGLTGIACCAGSLLLKPAHLTTAAEWQATLAANLTSGFGCVRAAGRLMKAEGGSVVLVSSAAARIGLANHEAIAAAKAGIVGLVLSAAATYARQRIRFNAVAPGLTRPARPARHARRCGPGDRLPARPRPRLDHRAGARGRRRPRQPQDQAGVVLGLCLTGPALVPGLKPSLRVRG